VDLGAGIEGSVATGIRRGIEEGGKAGARALTESLENAAYDAIASGIARAFIGRPIERGLGILLDSLSAANATEGPK
jgi:hypothetical protein